jgi:protein-L-isoaspartate(D-aspartate) O-methyltransferase
MLFKENGIKDNRVITAMEKVPRHEFVPAEERPYAYENIPLNIGYGQTISQPYMVALMTQILELKANDRVLEIGTGSGYQTAILAEIVREVYTIETLEPLARTAKGTLAQLGYKNINFKVADGYVGWEEESPFNAIIVTAAATEIPVPLKNQLAEGGRLVIPIGLPGEVQVLWKITKKDDSFIQENKGYVRFVPLTRK